MTISSFFEKLSLYADLPVRIGISAGVVLICLFCITYLFRKNHGKMVLAQFINAANGDKIEVNSWEVSLGRAKTCDIVLTYPSVSRFHAVVVRRNKGWIIYDTLSNAGVTVNGNKIDKSEYIYDGDIIALGTAVLSFRSPLFKRPESLSAPDETSPVLGSDISPSPNFSAIPAPKKVITEAKRNSRKNISALVNISDNSLILLFADDYLIGRASNCDIILPIMTVSKWHAQLVKSDTGWTLSDNESRGVTEVNGQTVKTEVALRDNDVINIGGVFFKYVANYMSEE